MEGSVILSVVPGARGTSSVSGNMVRIEGVLNFISFLNGWVCFNLNRINTVFVRAVDPCVALVQPIRRHRARVLTRI